jgi:hypothetical protein
MVLRAVQAVASFAKVVEKAQGLIRRVEAITADAERIANDSLKVGGKSDGPAGCALHSFVAGTAVLMADGSKKPINEVKVGDRVAATDPATGKAESREVVGTIVHSDEGT